jgi:hypothetical protein
MTLGFGKKEVEALIGSLCSLNQETTYLAQQVQKDGKPRDLAAERWIWELADIYKNAFGKPARVSGSGSGPTEHRGKFYHLLKVSRPSSFPKHGTLSARQIDRTLRQRQKHKFDEMMLKLSS